MKERDDLIYLKHILDAISQVEKYAGDINCNEFMMNRMIQDAVMREIEIIGEATKNLSTELKKRDTNIHWKGMAKMRDKLIHGYFGVDLDAVWDTATKDIPELKEKIEKIIVSVQM
jgi:uncharacterized protein with HEPN domain